MSWGKLGLAASISAIGNVIGSTINAVGANATNRDSYRYTRELQELAQAFSANEAAKNRKFQKDLSNTAYQRARADLEKAGLNPLISLMDGGASTPAGGAPSASGGSITFDNPFSGTSISSLGSSAVAAYNDAKRLDNETNKTAQDIAESLSREDLNKANEILTSANSELANIQKDIVENKRRISNADMLIQDVDLCARHQAMTGIAYSDVIDRLKELGSDLEGYNRLVKQYEAAQKVGTIMPYINAVRQGTGAIKDVGDTYNSFRGKKTTHVNNFFN